MTTSGYGGYTKIEQGIRAALSQRDEQLDPFDKSAWYFVVNFEDVRDGVPYGRLMRYEQNDRPFEPTALVDIPGEIDGDVRVANGRAHFAGHGSVKFPITREAADIITKIEVPLAAPKPLVMIANGQIEELAPGDTLSNPLLRYECGTGRFGLYVPDGTARVQINREVVGRGDALGRAAEGSANSTIWFTYIDDDYVQKPGEPRHRLLNEIIDPADILNHVLRQEFFLEDVVIVNLDEGAVFTVGGASQPGSAPFKGWIEEVIFDPSGGTGNGRKVVRKPRR